MMAIRTITHSDFTSILALNDSVVQHTSVMDKQQLQFLVSVSVYGKVAIVEEKIAAFLIALREGQPYESDNYRWFVNHFARFLYVDRIVVGSDYHGRKIGTQLYSDLFDYARAQQVSTVTCEYNIEPPNLASRAFHTKLGFRELDIQRVANGTKLVSLQSVEIKSQE